MKQEQDKKTNINTGLVSLEIIARFNQIDIDMRSIIRNYGIETAQISPEEIIRIAQDSEFKIKKKNLTITELASSKYPLPAIVRKKNGDYLVLLAIKKEENRAMILLPLEKQPQSIDINELQNDLENYILVLKHKKSRPSQEGTALFACHAELDSASIRMDPETSSGCQFFLIISSLKNPHW